MQCSKQLDKPCCHVLQSLVTSPISIYHILLFSLICIWISLSFKISFQKLLALVIIWWTLVCYSFVFQTKAKFKKLFYSLLLLYFVLESSWLTRLWQFPVDSKGTQLYIYTCIHSPPDSLPIQAATWHWAEFPVLYSRSLLVIHFKHSIHWYSLKQTNQKYIT